MLKHIIKGFKQSVELKRRIKRRHSIFWQDELAEDIRNIPMNEADHLHKWQDGDNWQRKLSNKFNAREFAKMNGCKVPDLYWKGSDIDAFDFSTLPPHYVIRPTIGHSSKMVFVMAEGKNLFDSKEYTPEQIKQVLRDEVANNGKLEFLIEEFLKNEKNEYGILTDFKFFCFNGEIATIMVINRLSPNTGFASFYDEHWNRMEMMQLNYPQAETQQAPACLADMVTCVKNLSRAYGIFVRIDFYATYKGCVFGEFTPTPSMGTKFTRHGKKRLLSYWDNYCKGQI
ncbi:hypothetical protein IM792_09300 [Mucilaginibacter sp. JRF]|uniref:ATP-grasp fold amidoligase family protein n=1 Tax=Mucilaginibacter sp. JRF TaxID=2780088 RepID=UPI001882ADE3|nr:ATP-grasp fold amidoligase family protein [Mucilaginibacter sp. JRF]MBE9584640.1 hypothetical protein [Mucilaginibacter sp. JRF]